ncbi:P-loop NTPase family protein [Roseococcus pinisoli]|uniref:Protein RecA n=1 Tax=Roseococcus pinisoli TaxID=2835040 RepID=A0ABS5QF51_9PROT|nr:hypothetical protein [Roseococcus pinisoli]MBS7812322.1 hypothetical protein [Roseococcus pinisoli]
MADISTLLKAYQKDYGVMVGAQGGTGLLEVERVATGVFEFDLASGGGFPRGHYSVIYGPESSAKTTLALKAIAVNQVVHPEEVNIFFDIEDALDLAWATKQGVDTSRLIVMKPDYAEQAVDMLDGFLDAKDCGIVVVDSLAALMGQNEIDSSAEKVPVGGVSNIVGRMTRKVVHSQSQAKKQGRRPTFIAINQTRFKIGQMMGNPETMSGGNAPKFASSMTVRCYGKNITDTKISKNVPIQKEVHFSLQKWKCPILSVNGVFRLVTFPHKGLVPGECHDWGTLDQYLRHTGRLAKGEKAGWVLDGDAYKTLDQIQSRLAAEREWAAGIRSTLIKAMLEQGALPGSVEE